jgi:outer membrane protein OmpA-like peptidoglycan-associated protein
MKNPLFAMLFLCPALALSAVAQQPSAGSGAQPPVQNVGTVCKESLEPAQHSGFWEEGEEPNVANLIGHGFTRKKDVQKQITPINTCLDELGQTAAAHTSAIKDMDVRAQQAVTLASGKTNEADQHATEATNRAQAAQQAASQISTRLSTTERLVDNVGQYQGNGDTEIQFRPGQTVLSKTAKETLDQLAVPLKDQANYVIEVRGFAEGHGEAAIADSRKMADSVARYLILNHQIPVHRIYVVGMGNAPTPGGDSATAKKNARARVEISLLKNDLAAAAQH